MDVGQSVIYQYHCIHNYPVYCSAMYYGDCGHYILSAAGEDFSTGPVKVTFGPWETTACERIAIFNDSIDEDSEVLQVVVLRESSAQELQVEEEVGSLPVTIQGETGV